MLVLHPRLFCEVTGEFAWSSAFALLPKTLNVAHAVAV
jgi:hypothetical protein